MIIDNTVNIDNAQEFMGLMEEYKSKNDYIFRGHRERITNLLPVMYRNCDEQERLNKIKDFIDYMNTKYSSEDNKPGLMNDLAALDCMAIEQNSNGGTFFLDATEDPLIATFFSTNTRDNYNREAYELKFPIQVIAINTKDKNNVFTELKRVETDNFEEEINRLYELSKKEIMIYDVESAKAIQYHVQNIFAQKGCFLLGHPELWKNVHCDEILLHDGAT